MPFKKGQSGNPGGRRKVDHTIVDLARRHTKEALEILVKIMRNPEAAPAPRVAAAQTILDRGWGKAPLVLAGEGGMGPAEITIRWEDQT